MDHIDRQRELLRTVGLVNPGNVMKMHYTRLGFGNEGKPYHFSIIITRMSASLKAVFLVPVSTKLFKPEHFVPLNLSNDSNLVAVEDEEPDLDSYALVKHTRQVPIGSFFDDPVSHLRGSLFEAKRKEILKARKLYLEQQFRNKQKGIKYHDFA